MKRTCTRVLRSALSLVLVFCLALSLCGAAFATETEETIKYVSLGDSMANGYGLPGYDYDDDGIRSKSMALWMKLRLPTLGRSQTIMAGI